MGGVWRAHADAVCTSAMFVVPLSVTLPRCALGVIELSPSQFVLCPSPKNTLLLFSTGLFPCLTASPKPTPGVYGAGGFTFSQPLLPLSPSLSCLLALPYLAPADAGFVFCLSLSARSTGELSALSGWR